MRPTWLLAAAFLAHALSGCASSSDGNPDAADNPTVVTDPRDYSYLANATPGSHIHDYWQGRDRVTVLDDEVGPFSSSCSGSGCGDGMTFITRAPEDGIIVPQGTRWINGTITFAAEGENTWKRLELWVRTAEDAEPKRWGDVRPGEPFSIESTNEKNDPPHYVLSLWEFALRVYGQQDEVRIAGTLGIDVEAVRGLALVAYPPHPDRWQGATELDLLEETASSALTTYDANPVTGGHSYSCYSGCPATHRLGDGIIVPFETTRVEARLTYGPGLPAGLGLSVHGADTRSLSRVEGTQESSGVVLFTIDLMPGMADSPYAKQSLWEFAVWMEYPNDPPVQAWSGEYTLQVKALR